MLPSFARMRADTLCTLRAQRPRLAYPMELTTFHAEDYINFLSRVSPDNAEDVAAQLVQFNMGEDCPVFDGLYDFCRRFLAQENPNPKKSLNAVRPTKANLWRVPTHACHQPGALPRR